MSVAIPVINSNSKVYVAVGSQNILAGVALTVVADTSTGNSDWLRILRGLPSNIFFPFTMAADVKGTAGLFTGEKVGDVVRDTPANGEYGRSTRLSRRSTGGPR